MTKRVRGKIGGEDFEMEIEGDAPGHSELLSELRGHREHREGETHKAQQEREQQGALDALQRPVHLQFLRHKHDILSMSLRHMGELRELSQFHNVMGASIEQRSTDRREVSEFHRQEREALSEHHAQNWAAMRGQG